MAERKVTILSDDFTGEEASDVRKVFFSFEGKSYRIDLDPKNYEEFKKTLAPYIKVSELQKSAVKASTATSDASARKAAKERLEALRAWAAKEGIELPARGRIPANIQEQFDQANPEFA